MSFPGRIFSRSIRSIAIPNAPTLSINPNFPVALQSNPIVRVSEFIRGIIIKIKKKEGFGFILISRCIN